MKPPEDKEKVLELYLSGPTILNNALSDLNDGDLDYIPSNEGWTIRQIVHHIIDGDDIWKTGIKMALGNEQPEFTLPWYWSQPQTEWAKHWKYEERSIEISLALLKANREHVLQLLDHTHDGWSKSVRFLKHNGETELIPIGSAIQIQADHLVHHVDRISEIRKEINAKSSK
ncbi:MAG: DinB family protein [Melioribacteraceae bacterium]|nr:DinB family protein [Melioribacteraceae bacterium]